MSMLPIEEKVYDDGLTKQSFKDACDINKIIKKAARAGTLSHLAKYDAAVYGEFDVEYDLLEAHDKIQKAQQIFDELPAEVRSEFSNNALEFAGFASNPANRHRLGDIFPALAQPGEFYPNPVKRTDVPSRADIDNANRRHDPNPYGS